MILNMSASVDAPAGSPEFAAVAWKSTEEGSQVSALALASSAGSFR
jgi:hypothetical protein